MSASEYDIERVRYGELAATPECYARTGLTPQQVGSMLAHPYAQPDDLAGVVLLREGRRAARIGVLPGRMRIGDEEHRIAWGSANWEYDGAEVNRGAAGLLLMVAMRESGTFAGCGPSEFSRPILAASRNDFLALPKRAALLRSHAFLRRRRRAAGLAAPAVDPLLRGLGAIRRGRAARRGPGLELAPIERFGPEVQRIDAARPRAGWFPRDHDELNWAMDHPWLAEARHLAFHLVRDGEVTGYALARVREFEGLRLGSLLRAGVLPGVAGGEDALVAGLVGHLDDERVDIADVCTANARLLAAAGRLGMLERPGIEIACRFDPETRAALERAGTRFEDFEGDYGEGDVIFA